MILISSSFVNSSFAYTEKFESLEKTLDRPPYICVVERYISGQEKSIIREIKGAVDEWRNLLQNQERDREAKAKWDIGYEMVPLTKQEEFDYSKCNIIIVFEPRPPEEPKQIGENRWNYVLGKTEFFSDEHGAYTLLTIYYQDIRSCESSRDEYYIYYKACYYDGIILAVKQANIAKYLIGQAFGLGQYVSDDPRVHEAWAEHGAVGPSIMMPYIHQSDTPQMITQKDIAAVRQIYGDEGFSGLKSNERTVTKTALENTKFDYSIKGGKVVSVTPDTLLKSLLIEIETTDDGELTLILPRSLMDSKTGSDGKSGQDDELLVVVDGIFEGFDEIADTTQRTLIIPFEYGTTEIEIIGTFLSPNFPMATESSSNFKNYLNKQYGFSLKIPKDWEIEEFPHEVGEAELLLSFHDEPEYPSVVGYVTMLRGGGYGLGASDKQIQQGLFIGVSQVCETDTFEVSGYTCSSPRLLDSETVTINGKKGHQITYSSIITYPTNEIVQVTSKLLYVPVGYDAISINIDSEKESFAIHEDVIQRILESLDTTNIVIEHITSEVQVASGMFTYLEAKNIPLIMVNPREFTPHWYVDFEHNFAIKFNNHWREHWSLQKTSNGNDIKFSSLDSPAYFLIRTYNDPAFVNEIKSVRVGQLEKILTPKAISVAKDLGAERVEAINVLTRSDGYIISFTLSKLEDSETFRSYDRFYLIHDNGKLFEITYSDIDYEMIPISFLDLMIRLFYDGDVSKIPLVEKAKPSLYSEEGFTYIPPQGWSRQDLNTELTISSGEKVTFTTLYYRDDFDGIFPSNIALFHYNFGDMADFDAPKDERLAGLVAGLRDSVTSQGLELVEITQSDIETFDDHDIMQLEAKIRFPLNSIDYMDAFAKEYAIAHKSGKTISLILYSDPVDFPIVKEEFNQSLESLEFNEAVAQTVESPQGEGGGGCLIATATYGSELSSQVQLLREVRDTALFNTNSGTAFMTGFNEFYYSFSPTIADWERQNPLFKESVKLAITPLLYSMSIISYINIDSEQEMLGYGISIILLNIWMYFIIPVIVITKLKKKSG